MKNLNKNFKDYLHISLPTLGTYGMGYLFAILLKWTLLPEEYGKLGYYLGISAFFQSIVSLGRTNAVDLSEKEGANTGTFFGSVISYSLIGLLIIVFMTNYSEYDNLLIMSYLHAGVFILASLSKSILTFRKYYKLFLYGSLLSLAASSIISTNAVISGNLEWRIFALITGDIILLFYFLKKLNIKLTFKLNDFLGHGIFKSRYLPLMLHSFIAFFYSFYDRIYIANEISFEESGKYWFVVQMTLPVLVTTEIVVRKKISLIYSDDLINILRGKRNYLIPIFTILVLISLFLIRINLVLSVIVGQFWNAVYLITNPILVARNKAKVILLVTATIVGIQIFMYHIIELKTIVAVGFLFGLLSLLRSGLMIISIFHNNAELKTRTT